MSGCVCFVFLVKRFSLCMNRLTLRVHRCGVRFERAEMRSEFFEVGLVTGCTELCIVELLELFHQFGVRRFEVPLRLGELGGG
jgi:hypothetical protein